LLSLINFQKDLPNLPVDGVLPSDDGLLSQPHHQEAQWWRSPLHPWERGPVAELAQNIYDKRAFERLPALADVLEEAGCTDAELLAHLRSPGPHVRGCFALDAVLGKG
jgi:hypothetical protein